MKFRMVDRILAWQPRQRHSRRQGRLLRGVPVKEPFGDEPCLPETLLVESLFQLGNWLVMLVVRFHRDGPGGAIRGDPFPARLAPGQSLRMEVDVRSYRGDGVVLDGRGLVGARTIAEGRGCLAAPVPLADYQDPDALRVLFSEIYPPGAKTVPPRTVA